MSVEVAANAASRITDEALDDLRRVKDVEVPLSQYNTTATEDAIRHYAEGVGDDNPRWVDPSYAADTRWGLIASPTFVQSCGFPRARGLPGIHSLFTGIDLFCHKPIKAGARIHATCALSELKERAGQFATRQYQQTYLTRYRDSAGELLSSLYSHTFRAERRPTGAGRKYADISPQHYTDAELDLIGSAYESELVNRRGRTLRSIDDVRVGEELPPIVKGPLTVTDCVCFVSGFGRVYARPHRQWYEYRKKHPKAGTKNEYGIWDVPERVHWENNYAQSIGMPASYDYGPQRIAWFDHCLSDWMGDDGWLRRLKVTLLAPNFLGDTTWIRGTVKAVDVAQSLVSVDLRAEDQRGRITATSLGEVVLPSK